MLALTVCLLYACTYIGPTPTILTAANVKFSIDAVMIVASWQVQYLHICIT